MSDCFVMSSSKCKSPPGPNSLMKKSSIVTTSTLFWKDSEKTGKKSSKVRCFDRRYIVCGGGNTNVRPVAAAITKITSKLIRMLLKPPMSGSNVRYFFLPLEADTRKGLMNFSSRMPCGEFQYARVLTLTSHSMLARFAPTNAGVLSIGRPENPRASFVFSFGKNCFLVALCSVSRRGASGASLRDSFSFGTRLLLIAYSSSSKCEVSDFFNTTASIFASEPIFAAAASDLSFRFAFRLDNSACNT
mmetsp:Transcript_8194/g.17556  ORF Transcript_8194/g.17556 Transcript_8194/m.17556 type:complete len:246 (-) Transcript_8194:497-1234(-)